MSERAQQTITQEPLEYRQDLPEGELPSQPSDPQRNPDATDDLATIESRQNPQRQEPAEIDLTIGVGEDPGWQRARHNRRWRQEQPQSSARQGD